MEGARQVLLVDAAFQPQSKQLIQATRAHNHKQLLTSTYLYQRGVLLAQRVDDGQTRLFVRRRGIR